MDKYQGMLIGANIGEILGAKSKDMGYQTIVKRGVVDSLTVADSATANMDFKILVLKSLFTTDHPETGDDVYSILAPHKDRFCSADYMTRLSPLVMYNYRGDYLDVVTSRFVRYTNKYTRHNIDPAVAYVRLLKALVEGKITTREEVWRHALSNVRYNEQICPAVRLIPKILDRPNIVANIFGTEIYTRKSSQCFICALYCFYTYFDDPESAIVRAANIGGYYSHIVAHMVGELVGAKNGLDWIPDKLQENKRRDELMLLGEEMFAHTTKW